MPLIKLVNNRFCSEEGLRITVQVPNEHAQEIINAVLVEDALSYGDYDSVTFQTQPGKQSFRSTGKGRNTKTKNIVSVPCVEVSFFLANDTSIVTKIIKAVYTAHPYEEPVIFVSQCIRTCHIRGVDEDNPNRFWNRDPARWVPQEHR